MSAVTTSLSKFHSCRNVPLSLYQPLNSYPDFVGSAGLVTFSPLATSTELTSLPPLDSNSTVYDWSGFGESGVQSA